MKRFVCIVIFLSVLYPLFAQEQSDSIHMMEEVIVNNKRLQLYSDMVSYMPTKSQVKASFDGISLLGALMIPQLNVNRMKNEVKAHDGQAVYYYIDGMKSDVSEVANLRPKDILRVEYYQNPTNRYAGKSNVLNFVLRHYGYGGYADFRSKSSLGYLSGEALGLAHFEKNKLSYNILLSASADKDGKSNSETESLYKFEKPLAKREYYGSGIVRTNSYGSLFKIQYANDDFGWNVSAGYCHTKVPEMKSSNRQVYSTAETTVIDNYSSAFQKGSKVYVNGELTKAFTNEKVLHGEVEYSYSNNNYERMFANSFTNIQNNAKDKNHDLYSDIYFLRLFSDGGQLKLDVEEFFSSAMVNYFGTIESNQNMKKNETVISTSYSRYIASKVTLSGMMGLSYSSYKVNGQKSIDHLFLRTSFNFNYTITEKSTITSYWKMINSSPSIELLNDVCLPVNELDLKKGNPNLKHMQFIFSGIGYTFYGKKWNVSPFVNYFGTFRMAKNYYYPQEDRMVNTNVTDGNYHSIDYGISSNWQLFKDKLQVEAGMKLSQYFVTGEYYKLREHHATWWLKSLLMLGNFSVSAYYTPKSVILDNTPEKTEYCQDSGLSVTYSSKGLSAELGFNNIFNKDAYMLQSQDTPYYNHTTRTYSAKNCQYIYLRLAYNFDFGRTTEKEELSVDKKIRSSILH